MTSLHLPLFVATSSVVLVLALVALGALSLFGRAQAGNTVQIAAIDPPSYCDLDGVTGCDNPKVTQLPTNQNYVVQWYWGPQGAGTNAQHTVTECPDNTWSNCGDGTSPGPIGNSGLHNSGNPYEALFNQPGTYYYRCENHPTAMTGTVVVADSGTPTPSPTPSPTASASPSPTDSATVTGTPTPTGTGTETPTATPTETPGDASPGDTDCDGDLDEHDSLAILAHVAKPGSSSATGDGCPAIGSTVGQRIKGDADCSGTVDPMDALVVLLAKFELSLPLPSGCSGP